MRIEGNCLYRGGGLVIVFVLLFLQEVIAGQIKAEGGSQTEGYPPVEGGRQREQDTCRPLVYGVARDAERQRKYDYNVAFYKSI